MSSCQFQIGLNSDDKSQRRAQAPPGGKVSITLSDNNATPKHHDDVNHCQAARNTSHVFEGDNLGFSSKGNVKSCQEARQKSSVFTAPLEPIPAPKKGFGDKSHGNILATDKAPPAELRSSVQVRAPPGGVSHISFG